MALQVNQRSYALPTRPVVVVCVDGCEPDYLAQAVATGNMPWMKNVLEHGTAIVADCVVPTFTNPNNLSIVTGVPPSLHGICGNYLYDTASDSEGMMNDPKWLCAPTVLAAMADAGKKVTVVTAKDKLRSLLGHQMRGIFFLPRRPIKPRCTITALTMCWLRSGVPCPACTAQTYPSLYLQQESG